MGGVVFIVKPPPSIYATPVEMSGDEVMNLSFINALLSHTHQLPSSLSDTSSDPSPETPGN